MAIHPLSLTHSRLCNYRQSDISVLSSRMFNLKLSTLLLRLAPILYSVLQFHHFIKITKA